MEFRNLKENEIECRVSQVYEKDGLPIGLTLLLYKNARTDSTILDETVGAENWQNKFYECKNNLYCSVGINTAYGVTDGDRWIWKDDCGSESNMEKEKGEASDAFKRACFKWGIGKELYTAPLIYIKALIVNDKDGKPKNWYKNSNGKWATKDRFRVKYINTINGKIEQIVIFNEKQKDDCFKWGCND